MFEKVMASARGGGGKKEGNRRHVTTDSRQRFTVVKVGEVYPEKDGVLLKPALRSPDTVELCAGDPSSYTNRKEGVTGRTSPHRGKEKSGARLCNGHQRAWQKEEGWGKRTT